MDLELAHNPPRERKIGVIITKSSSRNLRKNLRFFPLQSLVLSVDTRHRPRGDAHPGRLYERPEFLDDGRREQDLSAPTIYILGPGLMLPERMPDAVETPAAYGAVVIASIAGHFPKYEPFTPTYFYPLVEHDYVVPSAETYYVAVHEPSRAGAFGLAVGYVESFSPRNGFLFRSTRRESISWKDRAGSSLSGRPSSSSSSACSSSFPGSMERRPGLIILGLAGFVFWAGFLAGPAMTLLAGLLPANVE